MKLTSPALEVSAQKRVYVKPSFKITKLEDLMSVDSSFDDGGAEQQLNAALQHSADSFLKSLFEPEDHIFFLLLRQIQGQDETETKLLPLMPLSEAIKPEFIKLLEAFNSDDWNIFVSMNPFPEGTTARQQQFVKTIRNIYLDIDVNGKEALAKIAKAVSEGLLPQPQTILESSPVKFQTNWRVQGLTPLEAKALLRAMAAYCGGDPQATDLHRVLRVPGFKNKKRYKPGESKAGEFKYENGEFICALRRVLDEPRYKLTDFKIPLKTENVGDAVGTEEQQAIAGYVEDAFDVSGIEYLNREAMPEGGFKWFITCPWKATDHSSNHPLDTSSAVIMWASGKLIYECKHSHCRGHHQWKGLRAWIEEKAGQKLPFADPTESQVIFKKDAPGTVNFKKTPATSETSKRSISLIVASSIKPESQKWLWQNRVPLDTISNIVGEPDKGKGVVTADLVARLSTGRDFPDGAKNPFGGPVKSLMVIAEDSLKTTVVPRLMQHGANLDNVLFLDSVLMSQDGKKGERQLALDTDIAIIRQMLRDNPDIRFVVVDTVTSYMGNKNHYKDTEMRQILLPLRNLAEETRVTFLLIAHFNKTVTASAMNRTGGSIALTAVPRAVWTCVVDPEDKDRFLFLSVKGNLGKRMRGMSYTISEAFIALPDNPHSSVPSLTWGCDPVEIDADDALAKGSDQEERGVSKAIKFLGEYLADGKPHKSSTIYEAAEQQGLAEIAIRRARAKMGVETKRSTLYWHMRLPNEHNDDGKAPWDFADSMITFHDSDD